MTNKHQIQTGIIIGACSFLIVVLAGTTALIATREDIQSQLGISTSTTNETQNEQSPSSKNQDDDRVSPADEVTEEAEVLDDDIVTQPNDTQIQPETPIAEVVDSTQTYFAQTTRDGSNASSLNIRNNPCGDKIGSTFWGNVGQVIGEPQIATCFGREYTWRMVEWEIGLSGWSVQENLNIENTRTAFPSNPSDISLRYADAFKSQSYLGGQECGYQSAVTQYIGASSVLTVIDAQDTNSLASEQINSFNNVLRRSNLEDSFLNARTLFQETCTGYGSERMTYLEGIAYSGPDHYAFVVSVDGQDFPGSQTLYLFATKGESMMMVQMPVQIETNLISQAQSECAQLQPLQTQNCYYDWLMDPQNFEPARTLAKKIANDYALK